MSDGQLFTFDLISELLFQAGFVDVVERCYRRTARRFPEIAELDNRDESFFVETSGRLATLVDPRGATTRVGTTNVGLRSNRVLVEVVGILPAELDQRDRLQQGLIRGRINPQVGDDGTSLTIVGWVLGRESRAKEVELVSGSQVVGQTAVNESRPDVAKLFSDAPDAASSGFRLTVAPEGQGESELLVQVALESGAKVPIGSVHVSVSRKGLLRRLRP